jgi:hypothetical protein
VIGKRFSYWDSYADAVDILDDARAGRFTKAFNHAIFKDEEPDLSDDPMLASMMTLMLQQARRSMEMSSIGKNGGKKSGIARNAKPQVASATNRASKQGSKRGSKQGSKPASKGASKGGSNDKKGSGNGDGVVITNPSPFFTDGAAAPCADAPARAAAEGVSESDMWYYERGLEPPRPAPPIGDGD